jgi:quinoprotein glucose dehydrogenase
MTTGDKAWWSPNGGLVRCPNADPLFAGIADLGGHSAGGQAQVINTRTLVIYGTGRSGGPTADTMLYAVDKATGRQVGAVKIPGKTSAVPMTFLHQGRQYIVFATGGGQNPRLIALTLPGGGGRGGAGGSSRPTNR